MRTLAICQQLRILPRGSLFRTRERGLYVARPAGVEGWLPIAGLMNSKYFLLTGQVPAIHPAAMFLFLTFQLMSLLLKKAFCVWLCPVGTLSEVLWKLGRRVFGRNLRLPRWADLPLPAGRSVRANRNGRGDRFEQRYLYCRGQIESIIERRNVPPGAEPAASTCITCSLPSSFCWKARILPLTTTKRPLAGSPDRNNSSPF
jgi:hypothetical protein